MYMKKLIAMLLVLVMACSMIACGNKEEQNNEGNHAAGTSGATESTGSSDSTVPETTGTEPETTASEPEVTEELTLDESAEGLAMTDAAVAYAQTAFGGLFAGNAMVGEDSCVVSYKELLVKYMEISAEAASMTTEELTAAMGYDSVEAMIDDTFAAFAEDQAQSDVTVEALGSTVLTEWETALTEADAEVAALASAMGIELALADFVDPTTVEGAGYVTVGITAEGDTVTMELLMVKIDGQWRSMYSALCLSLLQILV